MVTSRLAPSPGATPTSFVRRFCSDKSGSIAIMFALMFVTLALFVGSAVDIARWLQARHQTIAAMDAAVLAGGRVLILDSKDVEGARMAAQQYYTENTRGRTDVIEDTIEFDAIEDGNAFAALGNAYLRTSFLSLARISKLPLLNTTESHFSRVEITTGGGSGGGGSSGDDSVEIALMLDVTGSMAGTKIRDLRLAAKDLVGIVISDNSLAKAVRVSLVPFSEGVRLPSSANSKARGSPQSSFKLTTGSGRNQVTTTYYSTDCVVERTGANKYTDVAPGKNTYVTTLYKAEDSRGRQVPCELTSAYELMPLTNDKAALMARIDGFLNPKGATAGHIGTAWAWYTLSPNWNTLWGASNKAGAFGDQTTKIAILMTDGEYNLQFTSQGVSASAGSSANGDSASQARALCTAMKAQGITIYTVGFALGKNSSAIQTLDHCASDPSMAYTPENGEELKQTFRDIAFKIKPLYLTH